MVKIEKITDTVVGDSKSPLGNLKARLMQTIKEGDSRSVANESPVSSVEESENIVAGKIAEIREKTCSLKNKIELFNRFAAGEYMQDNFTAAKAYLEAALEMDDGDEESLKNMAVTVAAMGNYDMAQALVAKMGKVDFALLKKIKEMKHAAI